MPRIQPTQYERGCVHDIDHVVMSKLPEGTKSQTNNQWILTCSFGPSWVWVNETKTWTIFGNSVNRLAIELPFEVAYELLQTIKTKKQLEEESKHTSK